MSFTRNFSTDLMTRLNRRDFTRLGALGLGAQLAPRLGLGLEGVKPGSSFSNQQAGAGGKKIGYAVIGLGQIAEHFMAGIQATSNSRVTAVVSGHRDKAERIAARYEVPKTSIYDYKNMDDFRANKEVDAVYVALPNSMHAEYTIRSAKAGKHVLCEKPMSTSVADAQAMISACKSANVKLMIAYRCHYEPTNLAAVKLIRDGALGRIQTIQSTFGFNAGAGQWRLSKALAGGGPLMDVGIYSLNATRYLTGEEPAAITASTYTDKSDPRFETVEENVIWSTKFPSGVLATCQTTYGSNMQGYYRVYGSKGWLEVNPAFIYEGLVLTAEYEGADGKKVSLDKPNPEKDPIHFTREAEHFSSCVLNNKTPQSPGEEGLRDMQLIDEIYKAAGLKLG